MARFYCKSCGKEVEAHAENCSHCGKEFTAVRCPKCGFTGELDLFSQGCPSCSYGGSRGEAEHSSYSTQKSHKANFLNSRMAARLLLPALLLLLLLLYIFFKQL